MQRSKYPRRRGIECNLRRLKEAREMVIPVIQGIIDRRILVNYRVEPEVMAPLLPAPFRPKLHAGSAVAGIWLIRLKQIRPRMIPLPVGLRSENAAHRVAVEWNTPDGVREGVYVPRRDTSSRLNTWAGGRLFPGRQHHARFSVREGAGEYSVGLESDDGQVRVSVAGRLADELPGGSAFGSLAEASAFFEAGSLGYSATGEPGRFDGMELTCRDWQVAPLVVERVESSYFKDRALFPEGSVSFDCALVMRDIAHQWHSREEICCGPAAAAGSVAP